MKDLRTDTEAIEWLGVRYKTILSSGQTNGAMSIVDSWSPAGSGPPRHIHANEDETFVMLSGINHTFKVTGNEPSRHLVILTPGGFEGFFADMAESQFRIPEDMPAVEKSAKRHHLTFTGPPLE